MKPPILLLLTAVLLTASAGADAQFRAPAKPPPTEISTDHVKVRYDGQVALAGDRTVSLIVNIEPRPGMHVYAPGADDYRIVNLTLVAPPGVKARPMKYPPSELYLFEALDERIPVYQKPFELVVRALVTDETKTLKGRLDYQACDDKICFPPVEVPLSWTIVR